MGSNSYQSKWYGYLAISTETSEIVGTAGFKGAPTTAGEVEIAYFTFPEYERRGFATVMAQELVAIARSAPEARKIVAHTLPENNASTRILEKLGLTLVGVRTDPEDGPVYRWELIAHPEKTDA